MVKEFEHGMAAYLKILRKLLQEKTSVQQDQQDIGIDTSKKESTFLIDSALFHALAAADALQTAFPNIANPVNLFNDMYHESQNSGAQIAAIATQPDVNIQTEGNIDFVPKLATIIKKVPMTANETLFEIKLDDGSELRSQTRPIC